MSRLDSFLNVNGEMLQYAAFFGAMVILGCCELLATSNDKDRVRLRRWPANFIMTITNIVVLGVLPISGIAAASFAMQKNIGLFNWLPIPPVAAFIVAILLRSLLAWLIHLVMHKIPMFWCIHRVHHTDTQIDVSTTVRFHPLEFIISTPILVVAIIGLGLPPVALIAYEIFDAAMAVVTHADIKFPRRLERIVRWVFVTPGIHKIHHSSWQPETDSNYGATLSLWDRLFGTYRDKPQSGRDMRVGLEEYRTAPTSSWLWLIALPFRPLKLKP